MAGGRVTGSELLPNYCSFAHFPPPRSPPDYLCVWHPACRVRRAPTVPAGMGLAMGQSDVMCSRMLPLMELTARLVSSQFNLRRPLFSPLLIVIFIFQVSHACWPLPQGGVWPFLTSSTFNQVPAVPLRVPVLPSQHCPSPKRTSDDSPGTHGFTCGFVDKAARGHLCRAASSARSRRAARRSVGSCSSLDLSHPTPFPSTLRARQWSGCGHWFSGMCK